MLLSRLVPRLPPCFYLALFPGFPLTFISPCSQASPLLLSRLVPRLPPCFYLACSRKSLGTRLSQILFQKLLEICYQIMRMCYFIFVHGENSQCTSLIPTPRPLSHGENSQCTSLIPTPRPLSHGENSQCTSLIPTPRPLSHAWGELPMY